MNKKRILSLFFALTLFCSLFSAFPAFAADVQNSGNTVAFDATDLSASIADGTTFGNYKIEASTGTIAIDANGKTANGKTYTHRLKLGGAGSYNAATNTFSDRGVSFVATSAGTLTVTAMSSSSGSDRDLKVSGVGVDLTQQALGASLTELTYIIPSGGTYYIYSASGGINIYGIDFAPTSTRPAWSTVSAPVIDNISAASGKITVDFTADISVNGADDVLVTLSNSSTTTVDSIVYSTAGTSGQVEFDAVALALADGTYTVTVDARRTSETTTKTATDTVAYTAPVAPPTGITWVHNIFGQNTDTANNTVDQNADGSVTLTSKNGKGKFLSSGADGMNFYYTVIPKEQNFELKGTVTVDSWQYSNGQEGFAAMIRDIPGTDLREYSNSYAFYISRMEYLWDSTQNKLSDIGDTNVMMKIGVGTRTITGVESAVYDGDANANVFHKAKPFDTSCAQYGSGTYNIIGNCFNTPPDTKKNLTTFEFTIKKTNTGFHVIYTDENGVSHEDIMYDWEELFTIDKDNIYVGFATARHMVATVSNIQLTTTLAVNDPPAQPRPTTYVTPQYSVTSTSDIGVKDYPFTFLANANGKLTVSMNGNVVVNNKAVTADTTFLENVELIEGNNSFDWTFTPDANYKPDTYSELSDYTAKTGTHSVNYKYYGIKGETLYVSPTGVSTAAGTSSDPMDIYTAVKYVQPGQTILVMDGTYNLTKKVNIPRGRNGTANDPIKMIADPNASSRPVFDFSAKSAGFDHWADYWYFYGFDITNTADMQKGFYLAGNNNILDLLEFYKNGNTGLQISGSNAEPKELWPSNNLVLNCTSYHNADKGQIDADGFAAKLTTGEGNIFNGCISHNNADDGFDLFAKGETGSIGKVTIKNCVSYQNGYKTKNSTTTDPYGGNGNGFKMGGTSLPGDHELINSIAFDNKAKGIDSNSCPDIQINSSSSLNNDSYNVALYPNTWPSTNFRANGIISMRTSAGANVKEQIELKQSDNTLVYNDSNYLWNHNLQKSLNASNVEMQESYFISLDTSVEPTRYADGSINVNGLLQPKDGTPVAANIGARFTALLSPSSDLRNSIGLAVGTTPADKTALEDFIKQLQDAKINLANYTDSSVKAYTDALNAAIAIANDSTIKATSQSVVDNALSDLQAAHASLTLKQGATPTPSTSPAPTNSPNPSSSPAPTNSPNPSSSPASTNSPNPSNSPVPTKSPSGTNTPSTTKAPTSTSKPAATGDNLNITVLIAVFSISVSAAAVMLIYLKKRKEQ